jgi:hypothetical protein
MSELPPEPPRPIELAYETPPPYGSAPLLVRLAAIFTFVSAGFDLIYAIISGIMIGVMQYTFTHMPPIPPPPGAVPPAGAAPVAAPPMPPMALFYGIYGGPGLLCLVVLGFKVFGGIKLVRRSPRAWGWGLATAIIGCTQFWMFLICCAMSIIPVGVGIYTLVVLCQTSVRNYLRACAADPQRT